jgi:hypothetical protein
VQLEPLEDGAIRAVGSPVAPLNVRTAVHSPGFIDTQQPFGSMGTLAVNLQEGIQRVQKRSNGCRKDPKGVEEIQRAQKGSNGCRKDPQKSVAV